MALTHYPALFQINTRVWLTELRRALGRPATLDNLSDIALDRLAEQGCDRVWCLSIWQTGLAGQHVSRNRQEWRREFQDTLPDPAGGRHRRIRLRYHWLHGASGARRGYGLGPAA